MKTYYYLIHLQYLGFRYHGWMKQPGVKTIEYMIEKTLTYVLGHKDFKILGASRTDARVSANHSIFELFVHNPLCPERLILDLNINLPNDIRVLKTEETDQTFNIIQAPRIKEYLYLFAFGEKSHPFCAPLLSGFAYDLDIEQMKAGALLFEGPHDFIQYCTQPKPGSTVERKIEKSKIVENTMYTANFFPKKSYMLVIRAKGFLRYQVRLIMGQLLSLGRGEISLMDIKTSLSGEDTRPLRHIAPASGLILNKIEF